MQDLIPTPLERRRLTFGLLFSLTLHAMLLSLTFGGQGLGLRGFGLPWQNRRIDIPDMHVVLLPTPATAAEPSLNAGVEPQDGAEPTTMTLAHFAPRPEVSVAASASQANPENATNAQTVAASPSASAISPLHAERPNENNAPPPKLTEDLIAVAKSHESTWTVPPTPEAPAPVTVVAPPSPDAADAKQDAQRQDEQVEAERKQVEHKEAALQEAAQQAAAAQAARQEAIRQELARAAAAKVESERQEAARKAADQQLAARQEAARAETARAEAERKEVERKEAARQEAAQQVAAQQEATRQAAIRIEATRLAALQAEAEQRQEKLRAIGRQLNEEADRRETAAAQGQLPSASSVRRRRLFGRADPNTELILYAEALGRKIEMNTTQDKVLETAKQPHTDPMVWVAVRSDGSVESVTFVVSSGVPAIDEAIRRIVYSQANYQAFPPALRKYFDVIEIRRTWYFDAAIRLY